MNAEQAENQNPVVTNFPIARLSSRRRCASRKFAALILRRSRALRHVAEVIHIVIGAQLVAHFVNSGRVMLPA
jgi:hypothetical protein